MTAALAALLILGAAQDAPPSGARTALGGFEASREVLDAMDPLGVDMIRATRNISWVRVEPRVGEGYDWSAPDEHQRIVQSSGHEEVRILNSTRPDDPGKPEGAADRSTMFLVSPEFRAPYVRFVRSVVERYDGDGRDDMPGLTRPIRLWSYTPEAGTWWASDTPEEFWPDFIEMLRLTCEGAHEADPHALVILPLTSMSVYLAAFADGFIDRPTIVFKGETITRAQANSGAYALRVARTKQLLAGARPDAYDIHLYGDAEAIPARIEWLLSYVVSQGLPARPVYSMEGGEPFVEAGEIFPQGPEEEDPGRLAFQSASLVKHFTLAFASDYEIVAWNLGPEYGDWGAAFGDLDLIDVAHHPRPACFTYRLVIERLSGFERVETVATGSSLRLYRFDRAGVEVWVAWDDRVGGEHDLSRWLPFPQATVTHPVLRAGETTPTETCEPVTAVRVGRVPVFIERR